MIADRRPWEGAAAAEGGDLALVLRSLMHELSNHLQHAVGGADLLAEEARRLGLPLDVRRELVDLADRLVAAGGTLREMQVAVRDGRAAAGARADGGFGR